MKITAFNGSPRGKKSNTGIMVSEFLKGAEKSGAEVEQVFLSEKKISHCLGCFKCWIDTPGECVIKDNMTELLEKVIGADIIILATPLYVDGVTSILKKFMDRLIPLVDPHFEKDENDEYRHVKRFPKYPDMLIISNCGLPGHDNFQGIQLHFKRMARNMHSKVIGEIYLDCGEMLRSNVPMLMPMISAYKKNLRKAGSELVSNGEISDKIVSKLAKSIIPAAIYIKEANKHWDKQLAKLKK